MTGFNLFLTVLGAFELTKLIFKIEDVLEGRK